MDIRFILIIAAFLILFVSMGKNPFEAPEGYVPPDEFKDGIRAKIEGDSLSAPGSFSTFSNPNTSGNYGSGLGTLVPNPGGPVSNPAPTMQQNPYGGTMQQQQGLAMPQPQPGIQPPLAPEGVNPYTGQAPNNYTTPSQPQPNNPAPFQSLPTPGAALRLPSYIPRFQDTQGRVVAFAGTEVYTTDQYGNAVLMADGTYSLTNGRQLIVKGGKRWWPVDANKL